jgi:hypothetical protein
MRSRQPRKRWALCSTIKGRGGQAGGFDENCIANVASLTASKSLLTSRRFMPRRFCGMFKCRDFPKPADAASTSQFSRDSRIGQARDNARNSLCFSSPLVGIDNVARMTTPKSFSLEPPVPEFGPDLPYSAKRSLTRMRVVSGEIH